MKASCWEKTCFQCGVTRKISGASEIVSSHRHGTFYSTNVASFSARRQTTTATNQRLTRWRIQYQSVRSFISETFGLLILSVGRYSNWNIWISNTTIFSQLYLLVCRQAPFLYFTVSFVHRRMSDVTDGYRQELTVFQIGRFGRLKKTVKGETYQLNSWCDLLTLTVSTSEWHHVLTVFYSKLTEVLTVCTDAWYWYSKSVCLSVRLFVRPSVTLRYHIKTA